VHPAGADCGLGKEAPRFLGGLLEVGVVLDQDVGDHDVGAGPRQRQRIFAPQPAGRPGDDGYLAGEVEGHAWFPLKS